jgi:hypothetical protein
MRIEVCIVNALQGHCYGNGVSAKEVGAIVWIKQRPSRAAIPERRST